MPSSCWRTSPATARRAIARLQAAVTGAREVTFTVVSMSVSLVTVFLPILLLGDLVGRLFP
ncbi:MAG: efflux RND transporter permease subunit [Geminicoccaceae bacterium]